MVLLLAYALGFAVPFLGSLVLAAALPHLAQGGYSWLPLDPEGGGCIPAAVWNHDGQRTDNETDGDAEWFIGLIRQEKAL